MKKFSLTIRKNHFQLSVLLIAVYVWFRSIEPKWNDNCRNEKVTGILIYLIPWHYVETITCFGWVKRKDAGEFDFEAYRLSQR